MRVNGRRITVGTDTLTYRGRTYPLAGARATYSERRQGIPLLSRKTVCDVQITGDGWTIAGRARALIGALSAGAGRRLVTKINDRVQQLKESRP